MTGTHEDLEKVLAKFSSAILVTASEHGLRGRPIAIQQRQGDRRIWMCTSGESDKAQDLLLDPRCALLFHDGQGSTVYASLSGIEPTRAEYVDPPAGKLGAVAMAVKRILTRELIAPKSEKSEVEMSP